MRYFFTADEHYGHDNIIKYCNRPFRNVEEMDDEIIKRFNSMFTENDIVIHAGDFTMKGKSVAENYIRRLKCPYSGNHVFLRGSHDYWNKELPYIWEKEINGVYVVVCHYAMRVWARSHYGSIQLYGHSHGKLEPLKNQWDIGVDNNNFYPVSLEDLLKKLKCDQSTNT